MFITTLTHFLNEEGNIPQEMPKEARELASFTALIVDEATKDYPRPKTSTGIRCRKKKCTGTIDITIDTGNEVIEWQCTTCNEGGRISGWQGSKWDNRK
ncbi:MAG: hypothetical protein D4R67_03810 [Bacteroidetes bacterium]|nr:MAG: hypothetical protein D4R67_03810 [Bacteroidota bacterium]